MSQEGGTAPANVGTNRGKIADTLNHANHKACRNLIST